MWFIVLALLAGGEEGGVEETFSPIKSDEEVTFFPTVGHLAENGESWVLPVHGWIYEPEKSSLLRGVTLEIFRRSLGLEKEKAETEVFKERARAFLVDNEANKEIPVRFGAQVESLKKSGRNGHFRGAIELSAVQVERLLREQGARDGWLRFLAVTPRGDDRSFTSAVQLLDATGLSVVSDIDDTIKVSHTTDREALLEHTFLKEFEAVAGMSDVYSRWAQAGASFHYVSASPWQLYGFLSEFLRAKGFPAGTFHLKDFRWRDSSFFNLFVSPEETKRNAIVPLLETFPKRKFIFVGDSGELDPEIYGALAGEFPAQIVAILIRDITGEEAHSPRYRKAFENVPRDRWQIFRDARELEGIKVVPR